MPTLTVGNNAYDTLANVDTYWSDRGGTAWAADTTANREIAIIKATDWLDRNLDWRGTRYTQAQRLGWPRAGAEDDDGYVFAVDEVPWQVEEAMAEIAELYRAGTLDMEGILTADTGRSISEKTVDVITIKYDTAYSNGVVAAIPVHVYKKLKGVVLAPGSLKRV